MEIEDVDWSELRPELISEIADHLGTRPNFFNFRGVCKNWRFSLSSVPRTLPQLSPLFPHRFCARNSDFFSSLSRGTLHHLVADAVYLLRPRKKIPESSKPWLLTVEELYRGKLSVRLPLSRIRAKSYFNNVKFPETLIMSEFHVSVIATGFSLRAPGTNKSFSENGGLANKNKLILFANPKAIAPLSIADYTALVWFDDGRVAWVRLSRALDWGYLACRETSNFDDIVNFRGRVYGVDRTGKVYAVNYEVEWVEGENLCQSLRMECVVNDSISSGCDSDRRKRLVVDSCGVLYVVERVKAHFKVYKLNEEDSKLEEVVGLGGDRILFVGVDWCFFASPADLPGWKGNCIVFVKNSFPTYGDSVPSQEYCFAGANKELKFAVFHFEDGNARPIWAFPGYSDLLWPPPAWFCPDLKLKKLKHRGS